MARRKRRVSATTKAAMRERAQGMAREGGRFVKKSEQEDAKLPGPVKEAPPAPVRRSAPARALDVVCEHDGCSRAASVVLRYQWRPAGVVGTGDVRQQVFCLAHAEDTEQHCASVGARCSVVARGTAAVRAVVV